MAIPLSRCGWKIGITCALLLVSTACNRASAQDQPAGLPDLPFHLTARPWTPLNVSRDAYLQALEGICRFSIQHQAANGAIEDPFLKREHQYSTPYFAFAVGALIHAGKAPDLLDNGVRAMDHATECFAKGRKGIPDQHGEFFDACLPGALELYQGHVPDEKIAEWKSRLGTPRDQLIGGNTNNWRTYAMKGEWLRSKLGLADPGQTRDFIEEAWRKTQHERIFPDKWNLYQDRETDPDSLAVEAVGRGNLLALIADGYDGPSAVEIKSCVERGTAMTLFLQDPSGQCAPNGRTDDHVFNDVLYQLGFEVMAERAQQAGDTRRAGEYAHAAMLSFNSIARWQRTDAPWAGSYYVTKNHFNPAQRVGYQPASNYGNYNGAVMMHLAEAYLSRKTDIPEQPAPVEIGGYAFTTDDRFASAVANAGGMQLFAALRGDTKKAFDHYWTPLGVLRFGRVGWDSRLGPSDGERDPKSGLGVSFAPTWQENGKWVRLADVPDRYRGTFSTQFVHPLLVRCAIDYAPITGTGPSFRHEFVITPDGVMATLRSSDTKDFGVTWPLLEDDGTPLHSQISSTLATTTYADKSDQQCFLALEATPTIDGTEERLQSTYGWLRPVRALAVNGVNETFVYPHSPSDPAAEGVQKSFHLTSDGFTSQLGSVHGTLYVGRTSAGGEGSSIDCDGDGKPDAVFAASCRFILQLSQGKIISVEADRETTVQIGGKQISLHAYIPMNIGA